MGETAASSGGRGRPSADGLLEGRSRKYCTADGRMRKPEEGKDSAKKEGDRPS